jgi:hypothetical protein
MNTLPAVVVAALAALVLPTPQDPQPTAPAARHDLDTLKRLSWLCGTWSLQDGDATTEEHWRPVQGTMILGCSHTFDASKTRFFEHLRIVLTRGQVSYLAMPGGKPPTAFVLQKLEDGVVEFENPKHDHPQRIRYEKTDGGIKATVSLLDGTRAHVFDFRAAR